MQLINEKEFNHFEKVNNSLKNKYKFWKIKCENKTKELINNPFFNKNGRSISVLSTRKIDKEDISHLLPSNKTVVNVDTSRNQIKNIKYSNNNIKNHSQEEEKIDVSENKYENDKNNFKDDEGYIDSKELEKLDKEDILIKTDKSNDADPVESQEVQKQLQEIKLKEEEDIKEDIKDDYLANEEEGKLLEDSSQKDVFFVTAAKKL